MLLTKELEIRWCPSNKNHFENIGYVYTHMGDIFTVKFEDMPHSSDRLIDLRCDYCNEHFTKQIKKYYLSKNEIHKDCCFNCRSIKSCESKLKKYGTISAYVNGYTVERHKQRYSNTIGKKIFDEIKNICLQNDYTLISDKYINNHTPIEYICNKHREEGVQKITWIHLKSGERCYYCGRESMINKQKYSYEQVKSIIEENGKNKLKSEYYVGYNVSNLKISCELCHKTYVTSLAVFIRGKTKCNNCTSSIGEQIITKYLDDNGIEYIREYPIITSEWDKPLRFDFYIPNNNLFIEYDGEQHFEPVRFRSTQNKDIKIEFKNQKIRDEIKNRYCYNNNIHLLRIPYWERDNINNILQEAVSKNDKTYRVVCSSKDMVVHL